jgi:hypothetical protein
MRMLCTVFVIRSYLMLERFGVGLLRRAASGWSKQGRLYKSAPVTSVCLFQTLGEAGAILDTPEANRFAADSDTSLCQQIFYIAMTVTTRLRLNR